MKRKITILVVSLFTVIPTFSINNTTRAIENDAVINTNSQPDYTLNTNQQAYLDVSQFAVNDYITNSIINESTGQNITCSFRIIKEDDGSGNGEVEIKSNMSNVAAISTATTGNLLIPESIIHNGKTYRITAIGHSAFLGCVNITSTGLASNSSITSVGDYAYRNCTGLTNTGLETNNSIVSIGQLAFNGCTNLLSTGLATNSSITVLKQAVFGLCPKLEKTGLEENTSVTVLGVGAFNGCKALKTTGLETNNTVKTIEYYAFANCDNLKTTGLETNTSVETIGNEAFANCPLLKSVRLHKDSQIVSLGNRVFQDCIELTDFVISGQTIPTFGTDVFTNTATEFAVYYPLALNGGSLDSLSGVKVINESVAEGETVVIEADKVVGKVFKHWNVKSGNVTLNNSNSESTSFTMINDFVEIEAVYEDAVLTIDANNFAIHINDVKDADIDALSGVKTYTNIPNQIVDYITIGEIEAKVGLYPITYQTKTSPNKSVTITAYVYDDTSIVDKNHIIYTNDFTVEYSVKHLLTEDIIISETHGNVKAYNIITGEDVSNKVILDQTDILNIHSTKDIATHPINVYLNTAKTRTIIQGIINVTIIDDREVESDDSLIDFDQKDNFQNKDIILTGDYNQAYLYISLVIIAGLIVIIFIKKNKKEER